MSLWLQFVCMCVSPILSVFLPSLSLSPNVVVGGWVGVGVESELIAVSPNPRPVTDMETNKNNNQTRIATRIKPTMYINIQYL